MFLALVANLIAAGVPVLHSLAHAEGDHHAVGALATGDGEASHLPDDHDALHQDHTFSPRFTVQFAVPAASDRWAPVVSVTRLAIRSASVEVGSPRAPPPGDPTRAPPLV